MTAVTFARDRKSYEADKSPGAQSGKAGSGRNWIIRPEPRDHCSLDRGMCSRAPCRRPRRRRWRYSSAKTTRLFGWPDGRASHKRGWIQRACNTGDSGLFKPAGDRLRRTSRTRKQAVFCANWIHARLEAPSRWRHEFHLGCERRQRLYVKRSVAGLCPHPVRRAGHKRRHWDSR